MQLLHSIVSPFWHLGISGARTNQFSQQCCEFSGPVIRCVDDFASKQGFETDNLKYFGTIFNFLKEPLEQKGE